MWRFRPPCFCCFLCFANAVSYARIAFLICLPNEFLHVSLVYMQMVQNVTHKQEQSPKCTVLFFNKSYYHCLGYSLPPLNFRQIQGESGRMVDSFDAVCKESLIAPVCPAWVRDGVNITKGMKGPVESSQSWGDSRLPVSHSLAENIVSCLGSPGESLPSLFPED